ncbi:MAG: XRE family transcriptional regulator [Chloroflexi bacterium]|nr:XRE family transcriptional regulator [Chloroflexota bacterium]
MIAANPEILKWARETAGLNLDEAAKKLGFRDSKKRTAIEKLESLESGLDPPTNAQLNKMAKAYFQPPMVFYLNEPPHRGDRGEDFRTPAQKKGDKKGNARLNLLMRDIKAAQNLVVEVLMEENLERLPFVNSATISTGVEHVANDIVDTIDFDLEAFRMKRRVRDAFTYLRQQIERRRIYVMLRSDLGSHHTTIPPEVFRGAAFADDMAPFVVINGQDAVSALSFTALHEVAHLWLGKSGVSGLWVDRQIERFCDRVAGQILFPPNERAILEIDFASGFDKVFNQITEAADKMNLSSSMVSYNLWLDGRYDQELWTRLQRRIADERARRAKQERERRKTSNGGPSYYTVKRHQLGNALVDLARYAVSANVLTPSKAAVVLGVAPRSVYPMLFPELS